MRAATLAVLWIVNSLVNAWAFWFLWHWFLHPLGAPAIGYWHAYGIGLFGSWLSLLFVTPKSEMAEKTPMAYLTAKCFAALLIIVLGFVIKGLMG